MKNFLNIDPKTRLFSESGFTLVEMLVAMTIASVFFASFTAVVIATVQTIKTGDQRTVAQQNARIAVNFMADEIKQMSELESPSYYEFRDPRTGGFPANGEAVDGNLNDVYPYYRLSTDGSVRGYIDLHHRDATSGIDEYEDFRDDGMPYDVRPLFPNKINFTMNQSAYFPHTRYSSLNPELSSLGGIIDLDGTSFDLANGSDNSQSAKIRVSYEHQKQPPRWGLVPDEGLFKNLYLPVRGGGGGGVNLFNKGFVLLRSFEIDNVTGADPNDWGFNGSFKFHNLIDAAGNDSGVGLFTRPSEDLRQIVADHVIDVRFRYFHIRGGNSIEIRYDPYTDHMSFDGSNLPANVNDGYYRYYDHYGQEIYVWSTPDESNLELPDPGSTRDEIIEHWKDESPDRWTFMPVNEYERGLLLFEGWRFVNTVMITVKGANAELQQTYYTSISHELKQPGNEHRPDYGLGFVDFQKGASYIDDRNAVHPLWHAVDSYREGVVLPGDLIIYPDDSEQPFDFVEPNQNPAFDPGRFVTLQTIVSPPVLRSTAREAAAQLQLGLSFI